MRARCSLASVDRRDSPENNIWSMKRRKNGLQQEHLTNSYVLKKQVQLEHSLRTDASG